jgi:AcrR family transcriptional regulator
MVKGIRTKADWLRVARLALLHQGRDGVRVEALARSLGVTKGSFYWHFRDRNDLLAGLLAEWEDEEELLVTALTATNRKDSIRAVFEEAGRRARTSERGDSPSDAAIFAWAMTDKSVARRVRKSEQRRMQLLRELLGDSDLADFFYYAYQGFLLRRRRVPEASADFETILATALRILGTKR